MRHRLVLSIRPGYAQRFERVCAALSTYRVQEDIDWPVRVETWLRNFSGLIDQETALSMLEALWVVSATEIDAACTALLAALEEEDNGRLFHFAEETSGGGLLRLLEKKHGIRHWTLLRGRDFFVLGQNQGNLAALSTHLKKLRADYRVVIWDTFLGTGGQMDKQRRRYQSLFTSADPRFGGLRFAFVTGHRDALAPDVHLWREVTIWNAEQAALNARYVASAVPDERQREKKRRHETGALVTFPDNPPNNTPLIVRARHHAGWATLLERRDTPVP